MSSFEEYSGFHNSVVVLRRWVSLTVMTLLVLVFSGGAVVCGAEKLDEKVEVPELPSRLWWDLQSAGCESLMRLDWQGLRAYPPIARIDAAGQKDLVQEVPIMGIVNRLLADVPGMDSDEVTDVWVKNGGIKNDAASMVYVKSTMAPEKLRQLLLDGGWVQMKGAGNRFAAPLSEDYRDLIERARKRKATDQELKKYNDYLRGRQPGLGIYDGGWWLLRPSADSLPTRNTLSRPTTVRELGKAAEYPWQDLVKPLGKSLAVIALNLPDNEARSQESSMEEESEKNNRYRQIKQLETRIHRLEMKAGTAMLAEMGDIFLRIDEVDGGLAIDGDIPFPNGYERGFQSTEVVIRTTIGISVMMLSTFSPNLADEIFQTTLKDEGDRLLTSTVLSMASMMDAVDEAMSRKNRLKEMKRRLTELKREVDAE